MNKKLVSVIVMLVSVCLFDSCWSQEGLDLQQYCRRNPLVVVESSNLTAFLEKVSLTDLASNRRWSEVSKLLQHSEHGFITTEQTKLIGEIWDGVVTDLRPSSSLASVAIVDNRPSWSLVCNTNSSSIGTTLLELTSKLSALGEQGLEPKSDTTAADLEEGKVHELSSLPCFCFHFKNKIIFSDLRSECERILATMQSATPDPDFKSLNDSRAYRGVKNKINQSNQISVAEISVQFNPLLVNSLLDLFDERRQQAWRIGEIAGIGFSVNIFDSETRDQKGELVINGFAKLTEPRVGISDSIRLLPSPKTFPDLPEKKVFFAFVNLDYQYYAKQKQVLYDQENGPGAYEKFIVNRSRFSRKLGAEYWFNREKSFGNLHGVCWYDDQGRFASCNFSKLDDVDLMIQSIETSSAVYEKTSPTLGYVREEIEGYLALLTKVDKWRRPERFGFIFKEDWMVSGKLKILQHFAQSQDTSKPSEIEDMINDLTSYVSFESGYSSMFVTWPGFWDTLRVTSVAQKVRQRLETNFKSLDDGKYSQMFDSQVKDFDTFQLDSPKSKKECREQIQFLLSHILMESFGKIVVLVGDEKTGFRLAAMTYKMDE